MWGCSINPNQHNPMKNDSIDNLLSFLFQHSALTMLDFMDLDAHGSWLYWDYLPAQDWWNLNVEVPV